METIKFMEHVDYFYEEIPTIYKNKRYTVHFDEDAWLIYDGKDILMGTTSAEDCFKYLQQKRVDIGIFHVLLHGKIATEAVLRRQQLKICEELIGIEAIDEQEKGWEDFANQIIEALEGVQKKKEREEIKSKLKVVD